MELREAEAEPDEVEARFQALDKKFDEDRIELPNTDEFEERFRKLESQVGDSKSKRAEQDRQAARRQKSDSEAARGAGIGLTVAYAILGTPMMGALIGYLMDREFGTNLWKGVLTLLGAVIGVTFAVVTTNRRL